MCGIGFVSLIVVILINISKNGITAQIYGGDLAEERQFPFIASIQVKNKYDKLIHICGGSILKPQLILTAIHCTDSKGFNVDLYRVFVGANKKENGQEYSVENFILEPYYSIFSDFENDLMFVVLTKPLEYSNVVQPIQINREFIIGNVSVVTAGWGKSNVSFYFSLPNSR